METDLDIRQLDDVEARLADFYERHDIHYLNLLPGFRERALTGEMLYYPQDGHWNALGHHYAAQMIHVYLVDHELIATIDP